MRTIARKTARRGPRIGVGNRKPAIEHFSDVTGRQADRIRSGIVLSFIMENRIAIDLL